MSGIRRRDWLAGGAVASLAALGLVPSRGARADDEVDIAFRSGLWFDGNRFVPRDETYVSGSAFVAAPTPGRSLSSVDLGGRFIVPAYGDACSRDLRCEGAAAAERLATSGVGFVRACDEAVESESDAATDEAQYVDVLRSRAAFARFARETAGCGRERVWTVGNEGDLARVWRDALGLRPDFVFAYLGGTRGLDGRTFAALANRAKAAGLKVVADVATVADARLALAAGASSLADLADATPFGGADAGLAARSGASLTLTGASFATLAARAAARGTAAAARAHGVALLFGSGTVPATVAGVARSAAGCGAFTAVEALRALCVVTPQALFPARRLGSLGPGSEATFLVLERDPLADLAALDAIALRFKAGRPVSIP